MRRLTERLGGEAQLRAFLAHQAELRAQKQRRISQLKADRVFVLQTRQLKKELEKAYGFDREAIESFFRTFPIPGPHNFQEALQFVETLHKKVQDALKAYVRYVSTHEVYFVLRNGVFDWKPVPQSTARKFLANLVDGRLEPAVATPDYDGDESDFEAPGLPVSPEIQELIDQSEAEEGKGEEGKDKELKIKFIEIQDRTGNSVLNDIERISSEADGVTFILHKAERPNLYVRFGEKVLKKPLQKLGKVVSAFQDEEYQRGRAGPPANMQVFENTLAAIDKGGPLKAGEPTPAPENQAQISQVKNPSSSETQSVTEQQPTQRGEVEKAAARLAKRKSRLRQNIRKPLPQP